MNKRKLIEKLLLENSLQENEKYGLLDGKSGICLYFFITGKYLKSDTRTQYGNKLLEDIYQNLSSKITLDLSSGLTGIALMISYLIHNGYSNGDINKILRKIDNHVYKISTDAMEMDLNKKISLPLLDTLIYSIIRYKELKDEDEKWLSRKLIIEIFNYIYINKSEIFFLEPLPFSLNYPLCLYLWCLTEIYKLGIEQKRIKCILREISYIVFAQKPTQQGNRLMLSLISLIVGNDLELKDWSIFSDSLIKDLNKENILNNDLHDKNIYPINGLTGICLLIMQFNKIKPIIDLSTIKHEILRKIINSSAWTRAQTDKQYLTKYGTLQGFLGTILFIDYILKSK